MQSLQNVGVRAASLVTIIVPRVVAFAVPCPEDLFSLLPNQILPILTAFAFQAWLLWLEGAVGVSQTCSADQQTAISPTAL